jgi:hypothetical protein
MGSGIKSVFIPRLPLKRGTEKKEERENGERERENTREWGTRVRERRERERTRVENTRERTEYRGSERRGRGREDTRARARERESEDEQERDREKGGEGERRRHNNGSDRGLHHNSGSNGDFVGVDWSVGATPQARRGSTRWRCLLDGGPQRDGAGELLPSPALFAEEAVGEGRWDAGVHDKIFHRSRQRTDAFQGDGAIFFSESLNRRLLRP